jgi:4-amino-4-deoxy-L-arabinose transferase-like glycosyltransferase
MRSSGTYHAWGYVDHPPLVAVFTWTARGLFGTSPFGLRVFPAIAAAALVVVTAALVRALGGLLNVLEPLFWGGAELVLVRPIEPG